MPTKDPGRGFFRLKDGVKCKACGGDAVETEGAPTRCSVPLCPNSGRENAAAFGRAAGADLLGRMLQLSQVCNMLADGLEAFAAWEPPAEVVEDVEQAGGWLRKAADKLRKGLEREQNADQWTPEALMKVATGDKEEP